MKFQIGHKPWNKDIKGLPSPFRGKKHTLETLTKLRGRKRSEETKARIREGVKNHPNRKGPKYWSEARKIAQDKRKGIPYKNSPRKRALKTKPVIKNGIEYHPLWHEIRKLVYKRDSYHCLECGKHCHNNTRIQCHHIDYNPSNNDLENLITLCNSCHAKTNFRRDDWISHLRGKIKMEIKIK